MSIIAAIKKTTSGRGSRFGTKPGRSRRRYGQRISGPVFPDAQYEHV